MKIIIGLGNPGKEYENTRHNIGFEIIDKFASRKNLKIEKSKFGGLYAETIIKDEKVILLKPSKYINLSGEVIKKYIDFYKINIEDILIISDDLDQELGKFKLKYKGSSGGHNGLKNIELNLKTNEYKRIKIGISNNKSINTKDYVLGHIDKETNLIIEPTLKIIQDVLDDYFEMTFDNLMNKYN